MAVAGNHFSGPTTAFSCGARSASQQKEQDYLRSMLSRRQLQGFVDRGFDGTLYSRRIIQRTNPNPDAE